MRWIITLIGVVFSAYAWFWVPGKPLGSDTVFKELLTVANNSSGERKNM
ncbi:hypothetical protein [Paenibacillus pabuli]